MANTNFPKRKSTKPNNRRLTSGYGFSFLPAFSSCISLESTSPTPGSVAFLWREAILAPKSRVGLSDVDETGLN